MRVDLVRLAEHCGKRLGMRQRDGDVVEAGMLALAPQLLGRNMQHDGLGRDLQRRHGDAVVVGEGLALLFKPSMTPLENCFLALK